MIANKGASPSPVLDGIPRDPSEILHDAAVISENSGLDDWGGLDEVAKSEGFTGFSQYIDDILDHWRIAIRGANPSTPAGRQAVADSLDVLAIHGRDLVRDGWGAVDLFGLDPAGKRHGLAMILRGGFATEAQRDFITYRREGEATGRTFWRGWVAPDALPFFEKNQNNQTKGGSHGGR